MITNEDPLTHDAQAGRRSMTSATGIWNTANAQPASAIAAKPMDSSGADSTASSSSTISANDFLTLLVTEMKNQDPTSATDPNQYINQLVSVNSLQQLIQINQTLSGAMNTGTTSSSSPQSASSPQSGLSSHLSGSASSSDPNPSLARITHSVAATAGNLGVPAPNPAAQSVAQALSGRARLN
jgi:flagellar basal-body rod modification protein FlgD